MFKNILILFFHNPISVYFYRLINQIFILYLNRKKYLKIWYLCLIRNTKFWLYNSLLNNVIINDSSIWDYSYIASNTSINNVEIWKYCSISANCQIWLWKHPTKDFVSTHPIFYSPYNSLEISFTDKVYFNSYGGLINIWNDVWIWTNVIIPNSINIWDGAIIATWSIVTKDVPAYSIVGWVPAKIIRYRFEEEEIDFLLKYKWWDKDISFLKENYKKFHSIKDLKNYF